MRGGYQIIDLKNRNLTTTTTANIKGIYNSIESNYRKPILLSGIVIDSVEKADTFVTLVHNGSRYTTTIYGVTLTIADSDNVTITAVK